MKKGERRKEKNNMTYNYIGSFRDSSIYLQML
jgi:hypothetical protein